VSLRNIGALWLKEGKKGRFMAGELQLEGRDGPRIKIMVFKNQEKKDRQPDYRIVQSDDDGGDEQPPF